MESTFIDNFNHPLYAKFRELYAASFPVFEQRNQIQQRAAFDNSAYRLIAYSKGDLLIGFIGCWRFDGYVYIEHFAINDSLRNEGWGSELLGQFVERTSKIVVLEIDPIVDAVSQARLRFYEKCGFVTNKFAHIHPPYRVGNAGHQLVVLSSGVDLSDAEHQTFVADLGNVVMAEGK